jgi:short-subunit dehydrogenase
MTLILGATGCIGLAFARELRRRGQWFIPLSRHALEYTRFELLFDNVPQYRHKPAFCIKHKLGDQADVCENS